MLKLLDKSVLQLSVTALFYLEDSRKNPSSRREGTSIQRHEEKSTVVLGVGGGEIES